MGDLTAWLDELEEARKAATPGVWRRHAEHLVVDERGVCLIAAKVEQADAALIAAEHNATPKLTAALRAVLALAEQFDAEAEVRELRKTTYPPSGPWAIEHNRLAVKATTYRNAADRIRAAVAGAVS